MKTYQISIDPNEEFDRALKTTGSARLAREIISHMIESISKSAYHIHKEELMQRWTHRDDSLYD